MNSLPLRRSALTIIILVLLFFKANSQQRTLGIKDTLPDILQIEMIAVNAGSFMMGIANPSADDKLFYLDAIPAHKVELSSYQIAMLPVNEALWEKVMGTTIIDQAKKHGVDLTEIDIQKKEDATMRFVSWIEVKDFIQRLNALTNKNYRLPSEAEWEYASVLSSRKAGLLGSGISANSAKQQKENRILVFNYFVEGWEWCSDWHDDQYYSNSPLKNPKGPNDGRYKARRGWAKNALELEPIKSNRYRSALLQEKGAYNLGFRLAHN